MTQLLGINAQIDLGNFAVGIGTLVVALVSFLAIRESRKTKSIELSKASDVRIAEFRMKLSDRLREDTASFIREHRNISLIFRESGTGLVPREERPSLLELYQARARLRLDLKGHSDADTKDLAQLVEQDVSANGEEAIRQRDQIMMLVGNLLKTELAKAKEAIETH